MSLKSYVKMAVIIISLNLVSVYTVSFAIWTVILTIFFLFIVSNRDSNKRLIDKKIMSFIQAFMLCATTFIFTVFGISLLPVMHYVVQTYVSSFYYLFLLLGVLGLIGYYYLVVKLLVETIKVMKQSVE